MHYATIAYASLGLLSLYTLYTIITSLITALTGPTRSVPGPFIARFSRLWYFFELMTGQFHDINVVLQRKYAKNGSFYAPVIRVGPNMYSISRPDKSVYGIGSKMPKSSWYEGWKHPSPERWTLFPDRDMKRHGETRRKFQNLYSMSSLVNYEAYVDECLAIFRQRLNEMASSGKVVDMHHWLQCYAFDVIGNITYSKRFGFLDQGHDIDGTVAALQSAMWYSSHIGVYAWLHPYLYPLAEMLPKSGAAARTFLMSFVTKQLSLRDQQRAAWKKEGKSVEAKEDMPQDFLDKLLDAAEDGEKGVTRYHCFMMSLSNIIAGSDTTAISLSSTLYYLIRNQSCLAKLRSEITTAIVEGRCTADRVGYKESQDMRYLQACIKEALRVHPATGLPLWRVVPEGGAEICGQYFPAGSEVGLNTWVAHYDEDVWGKDAAIFRPERWIEAEEMKDGHVRLKEMEANYMPVGVLLCLIG